MKKWFISLLGTCSALLATELAPIDETVSQATSSGPSYEASFFKMLFALVGLLIFLFVAIWVVRRISHHRLKVFGGGNLIKIIDRRPLSGKTMLYLIEVKDKHVLIAESQLETKALLSIENDLGKG